MEINTEAIMSMEQTAKQILMLPEEARTEFYGILLKNGLTEEDVNTLKKCVGYYHLMTDAQFYKAARQAMCETFIDA